MPTEKNLGGFLVVEPQESRFFFSCVINFVPSLEPLKSPLSGGQEILTPSGGNDSAWKQVMAEPSKSAKVVFIQDRLNMLKEQVDMRFICKVTGMSEEEINKLKSHTG